MFENYFYIKEKVYGVNANETPSHQSHIYSFGFWFSKVSILSALMRPKLSKWPCAEAKFPAILVFFIVFHLTCNVLIY
jgi:hypothetical protein